MLIKKYNDTIYLLTVARSSGFLSLQYKYIQFNGHLRPSFLYETLNNIIINEGRKIEGQVSFENIIVLLCSFVLLLLLLFNIFMYASLLESSVYMLFGNFRIVKSKLLTITVRASVGSRDQVSCCENNNPLCVEEA